MAERLQSFGATCRIPSRLAWIENTDVTVKYTKYDWGLNDQSPAQ